MTYYNHIGDEMVEKAIDIIKERLPLVAEQPTSVDDDRFVTCYFLTLNCLLFLTVHYILVWSLDQLYLVLSREYETMTLMLIAINK